MSNSVYLPDDEPLVKITKLKEWCLENDQEHAWDKIRNHNITIIEKSSKDDLSRLFPEDPFLGTVVYNAIHGTFETHQTVPFNRLKLEKIVPTRAEWFRTHDFEFPKLVDRDAQQEELKRLMLGNLESFLEERYNNQSWTLLTIFGVSGSGKTRLSFEVVERLQSAIAESNPKQTYKFVDIYVKFINNNEDYINLITSDCKKLVACCLSCCLHRMDIFKMMTTVSLDQEDLVQPIKSVYDVQDTDQLVIFLRIDEIQFLMRNIKEPEEKHRTALYKFSLELMSCVVEFAQQHRIFILPIYSGTLPFGNIRLFPPTLYKIGCVSLPFISIESAISLTQEKWKSMNPPRDQLTKFMTMIGPKPRALESLFRSKENFTSLAAAYGFASSLFEPIACSETFEKLLYFHFTRMRYERGKEPNIELLITSGELFLTENDQLELTFAVLHRSVKLHDFLILKYPFLRHVEFVVNEVTPEKIEQFVPQYFAFLQNLYCYNKINRTSFGSFFRECFMSPTLSATQFDLGTEPIQFFRTVHTKIEDLGKVKVHGFPPHEIDLTKTAASLWIGKDNSENDFCIFFPEILVKGQVKVTTVGKQISLTGNSADTFQTEMSNALKGPTKPKGKALVFLFVTNGKMTPNANEDNMKAVGGQGILLSASGWVETFTQTFWFLQSVEQHKKISTPKEQAQKVRLEDKESMPDKRETPKKEKKDKKRKREEEPKERKKRNI